MHLNMDCVRDVMMAVESNALGNQLTMPALESLLPAYSSDELEYACLKLGEANMLDIITVNMALRAVPSVARINELTYEGHEFLANIKSPDNWEKLSSAFKQGASASLKVIADVAIDIGKNALKSKLGL